MALDNFKRDFRTVIATRAPQEDQEFFLPSKVPKRRLGCYGISNHVAALVGTPCWPPRVSEQVALVIVGLITPLTPAKKSAMMAGSLQVEERQLKLKGAISWLQSEPPTDVLPKAVRQLRKAALRGDGVSSALVADAPPFFVLSCPHCRVPLDVAQRQLLTRTAWRSLLCNGCRVQRLARKWLCSCARPWPFCPTHRPIGLAYGRPPDRG